MCYAVPCTKCKKTTWKGCGRHVESDLTSDHPNIQSNSLPCPNFSDPEHVTIIPNFISRAPRR
ncbi:hypothetical protein BC937DRAFT_90943 [Endogone sp. FLAS-F59071]|nr:hypothetical protein BC937DRAFT_90943 [Endogone sp. FLAS-F59071]|eukprot:RUS21943.1 hypothetical protein BC937DRAFT_90943 [Endogone sp. FLAS-F59071]